MYGNYSNATNFCSLKGGSSRGMPKSKEAQTTPMSFIWSGKATPNFDNRGMDSVPRRHFFGI